MENRSKQFIYLLAIVATAAEQSLQVGMRNSAWSEPGEQIFTVAKLNNKNRYKKDMSS